MTVPAPAPLRWDEVLLHAFPENIAKSVVGNCLASVVVARWEGEFGFQPPAVETLEALPPPEA